MNLLEQCLAGLADLSLGEVVHVHPSGAEAVDWALQRGARRVVASTADADVLALLQRRASPVLDCRDRAVADQAGPPPGCASMCPTPTACSSPMACARSFRG